MWPIRRTKPIGEKFGFSVPAFIRNMDYFLVTIDCYSDGVIDAWGGLDLDLFDEKLRSGWVWSEAPDGSSLSIHNLGGVKVSSGQWLRSISELRSEIHLAIRSLNPELLNLVNLEGEASEKRGKVRYSKLGLPNPKPYKRSKDGNIILGESLPIIVQEEAENVISKWFIFSDGTSQIGAEGPLVSLGEVEEKIRLGELTTKLVDGKWTRIPTLGVFKPVDSRSYVNPTERIREAQDLFSTLQGSRGSIEKCRLAYAEYEENPSDVTRHNLKQAYENVPEHLRMYCGDMDSKDFLIRAAIYGDAA